MKKTIIAALALQLFELCKAWIDTTLSVERHEGSQLFGRNFFRGRSVPYAETLAEQKSRELWEQRPFDRAQELVGRILSSEYPSELPALKKIVCPCNDTESSGFEDLFLPLYGTQDDGFWDIPDIEFGERRDKLKHFLIRVGYKGSDFCGWQLQPDNGKLPSVQGAIEDWLEPLAERRKSIRVCGRTDAGVSAIAQVCRFRTALDLEAEDVEEHLRKLPSSGARVQQVVQVTRAFHPTFTATCRAYVYLIDSSAWCGFNSEKLNQINQILQALEGKELDYIGLSYGRLKTQTSLCKLHHARACVVSTADKNAPALCIELVGNRFLRRMVRLLVESTVRIALTVEAQNKDSLLEQVLKEDRSIIGNNAPADGLFFVGARFSAM